MYSDFNIKACKGDGTMPIIFLTKAHVFQCLPMIQHGGHCSFILITMTWSHNFEHDKMLPHWLTAINDWYAWMYTYMKGEGSYTIIIIIII